MDQEMLNKMAEPIRTFRLPRYHEIPNVGLYLEQVTKYISECFAPLMHDAITSSMIANYVKRGLLSNPVKKQYSREQIAYLIYISTIKTVLSMEDIRLMISVQQDTYIPQIAYDYFCSEFENYLQYVFGFKSAPDKVGVENTNEKIMLRNAIVTASHKIYLDRLFHALQCMKN